jgi:hypothetical protein
MLKALSVLFALSALASASSTHQHPVLLGTNRDGDVHLAVRPRCGKLGGPTADVNAGINPSKFKTIVSFGVRTVSPFLESIISSQHLWHQQDSYTDGGKQDGSPLDPPIIVPPSVLAGGRSTNGYTWIEEVAFDLGNITVKDYAVSRPFL